MDMRKLLNEMVEADGGTVDEAYGGNNFYGGGHMKVNDPRVDLLDMIDNGQIDKDAAIHALINWLSHDEVRELMGNEGWDSGMDEEIEYEVDDETDSAALPAAPDHEDDWPAGY